MIFIVNAETNACFKIALNTGSRTLSTIDALPDALVTQLRDVYAGDAS